MRLSRHPFKSFAVPSACFKFPSRCFYRDWAPTLWHGASVHQIYRALHASSARSARGKPAPEAKKRDYYEELGVSKDVSKADLKKAYYQMAQKYHPDKNAGDPNAAERFAAISNAYEVLSDDARRQAYDNYGHQAEEQGGMGGAGFTNAEDLFAQMFGGGRGGGINLQDLFGGQQQQQKATKGADAQVTLKVTFKEAVTGISKAFSVDSTNPCETCKGSGDKVGTTPKTCPKCKGLGHVLASQGFFAFQSACPSCDGLGQKHTPCSPCNGLGMVRARRELTVKLPAGVDTGTRLRLLGQGDCGPRGVPRGNLWVQVAVEPDPVFTREGVDVHVNVSLPVSTAALGGKITVPSLTGDVILKVAPGTQPEDKLRMRGKGIASLSSATVGDQFVHFKVHIPTKLTAEQRDLMEKFAITEGVSTNAPDASLGKEDKGFFGQLKDVFTDKPFA